jgi:LSD1 subclass zinc finger protein
MGQGIDGGRICFYPWVGAQDLIESRLLHTHRPHSCTTPLMRERGTRQVYCVVCDLPVGPLPPPGAAAAATADGTAADGAAVDGTAAGGAAAATGRPGSCEPGTEDAAADSPQHQRQQQQPVRRVAAVASPSAAPAASLALRVSRRSCGRLLCPKVVIVGCAACLATTNTACTPTQSHALQPAVRPVRRRGRPGRQGAGGDRAPSSHARGGRLRRAAEGVHAAAGRVPGGAAAGAAAAAVAVVVVAVAVWGS